MRVVADRPLWHAEVPGLDESLAKDPKAPRLRDRDIE